MESADRSILVRIRESDFSKLVRTRMAKNEILLRVTCKIDYEQFLYSNDCYLLQKCERFADTFIGTSTDNNRITLSDAVGIWIILFSEGSYFGLIAGMSLLGVGTALVYPTLLAAISDIANPQWRATSLDIYRFWRDLGFVFGAVGIGLIADTFDLNIAIQTVAWISLGPGIIVLLVMKETRMSTNTVRK